MRFNLFAQAAVGLTIAATTTDAASLHNRAAACAALPAGSGPKANPDTVPAFLALPAISNAANTASTPKGYVKRFSNVPGANIITNQYLGVAFLTSYNADLCAAKCNVVKGCQSFNLYFERDPSQEPGSGNSGCANPCSTTNIKCALFSGEVTSASATNKGQWRNKFQVAIAGSNGYTNALYLVSQARGEIGQSDPAQSYCSSILGYTTPVITTTVIATSTPLGTVSLTGIQTNLITATQIATRTQTLTAVTSTTTTLTLLTTTTNTQLDSTSTTATQPSTTTLSQTITVSTTTLINPTTTIVTSTLTQPAGGFSKREASLWTSINGIKALALPTAPAVSVAQRRDIPQPSVLSKYPASIVTAACSLAASPVTKTRTVTSLRTSTVSTVFTTEITSTTTANTATVTGSTLIYIISDVTNVQTVTTSPAATVTTTLVNTQTITESPTITLTSEVDVTATSIEVPTITVTTITTTTAAPVCTVTSYKFQVLGGSYNGQYLAAGTPDTNWISYGYVQARAGISDASTFRLRSDGRVYDSTNVYGWVSNADELYYVLDMTDRSQATYGSGAVQFLTCSIEVSSAVVGVSGATGALICRRGSDGSATNLVTCSNTDNNLLQSTSLQSGCTALLIAAIPAGTVNC